MGDNDNTDGSQEIARQDSSRVLNTPTRGYVRNLRAPYCARVISPRPCGLHRISANLTESQCVGRLE